MKALRRSLAIIMVSMLALGGIAVMPMGIMASTTGTTYYLDAVAGDDSNDGQSISTPWKTLVKVNGIIFQPDDRILLKTGSIWSGQLWPKGSGSEGSPIIIDMYGDGNKPIINAGGIVESAVRLENQEYWEINNLELTNMSSSDKDLRGIYVTAVDYGEVNHIYVKDCYIHDVNGKVKWKRDYGRSLCKRNGGIIFDVLAGTGEVETYFEDIQVIGNHLRDCSMIPIAIWQNDEWGWLTRSSASDTNWLPNKNVIYRNNYVEKLNNNSQTCAILMYSVQGGLAEYNVVASSFTSGIECGNSDDIVFQYNEAGNIAQGAGGADSCAFDQDEQSTETIFQYNYMHDSGVGLLIYGSGFGDNLTARYNIIQNSWHYNIFNSKQDQNGSATVYNNTLYATSGKHINGGAPTHFYNNIFYGDGRIDASNATFDYNAYYLMSQTPNDPHKITEDPKMHNPGEGEAGDTSGIPYDTLVGYKLAADSSLIGAGRVMADNGGLDFWGKILKAGNPDIGASQYDSSDPIPVDEVRYEAEDATLSGVSVEDENSGYKGTGYVDYMNLSDDYIEWTIEAGMTGEHIIDFTYANGDSGDRPLQLMINGIIINNQLLFPSTSGWSIWEEVSVEVNLQEGSNMIRLTAVGNSGSNLDYMKVTSPFGAQLLEAEQANLSGVGIYSDHTGYSGSGFADYMNDNNDYIEWAIDIPVSGHYVLGFKYANGGDADRPLALQVNNQVIEGSLSFPQTTDWDTWESIVYQLDLNEGDTSIRLSATGSSGSNIDYMTVILE